MENISAQYNRSGNLIGYRVRSRKQGIEEFFSKAKYGSLEKAMEAAKAFRKKTLGGTLTNEDYLKLRNQNSTLSAKEFAAFLNKEGFTPKRGNKFTKIGIKQRDLTAGFKSTRKVLKKVVPADTADKIYKKYLKLVSEGKREGAIIGLGREYFPGQTRDSQQKAIQRILREKGEDITKFKKTGPGSSNLQTKANRIKNLIAGKKAAGAAGQISDEIILDIKFMNDKVKNMSLEDIAANKKYITSMRINASMDNLSKGQLTFDKYKNLTDLEVAEKIKDRAKANKFFDVEHISSVKGKAKNIYYPNNIQMAPGNIGSFMDNFKRIPIEQPNNSVIPKIDKVLSNYNLTVRDPKNNIKLGNKAIIEVTNGVSNIVRDNFNAVDTVFEKQKIVMPTPSRAVTKQGIVSSADLLEVVKKAPQACRKILDYSTGGISTTCAAAIKADPVRAATKLEELKPTSAALGKVRNAARSFLNFMGLGKKEGVQIFRGERAGASGKIAKYIPGTSEVEFVPYSDKLKGRFFTTSKEVAKKFADDPSKIKSLTIPQKDFNIGTNLARRINVDQMADQLILPKSVINKLKDGTLKYDSPAFRNILRTLGKGKIFTATAAVGVGTGALVKKFMNDDPSTYLTNDKQANAMILDTIDQKEREERMAAIGDAPELLDEANIAANIGVTAAAVPGASAVYAARRKPFKTRKAMGPARAALGPVGKALSGFATPAGIAALTPLNVASSLYEGDSAYEVATDPLNYLGPAFAGTLSKEATRGMGATSKLAKSLRLGMSPGAIKMVSRRFGLPGLALSAGISLYELADDYKSSRGMFAKKE